MKKRHQKQRNVILVLAAMMLVAAITAGSVFAYLRIHTGAVENSFGIEDEADPTVSETFADNLKTNVAVNVGETGYAVYVRAVIVVTWKNGENGDVLGQPPVEGVDYEIILNTTDWFKKGDFYYCKTYVESGKNSPVLITSVKPTGTAPSGYGLNVEIITQTIQAAGTTDSGDVPAVTDAWGITVSGGKLVDPNP